MLRRLSGQRREWQAKHEYSGSWFRPKLLTHSGELVAPQAWKLPLQHRLEPLPCYPHSVLSLFL
jgi:hypothetical protein